MIVMHGLLSNKKTFKTIVGFIDITYYRTSYLVDMRNHSGSHWHDEFNYERLAEDVIRFAD